MITDPSTGADLVEIRQGEQRVVVFNMSPAMSGDAIASVVQVTANPRGLVSGSTPLGVATPIIKPDASLELKLSGAVKGEEYDVEATVSTATGQTVVDFFVVRGI